VQTLQRQHSLGQRFRPDGWRLPTRRARPIRLYLGACLDAPWLKPERRSPIPKLEIDAHMNRHIAGIQGVAGIVRSLVSLAFDRRTWQRLTVYLPVNLILPKEGSFPHPARLRNLSNSGAKLSMLSPVNIGTQAVLEHANSRVQKACTVRFCRREVDGFSIGLEFEPPLSSHEFETICLILRH
jgi:hypothetical protein